MNKYILNTEIQDFINSNLKSDITKLILKGCPFTHVSIQEIAEQIISKNKCESKLPTWFKTPNCYFPNKLNIEQTSSEITAKYKSDLIHGNSLIDITGGLGVDTFYFSQKVKNITYCEVNQTLFPISTHNFQQLGTKNIATYNNDGLEFLKNTKEKFDWIYIDPSRRDDVKGKVFLLNDCLPNIPQNLNFLFEKSNNLFIKLSPILDLTSAVNELNFVKEIHVVAIENEVKELLFILEKNYAQTINIKTVNISKSNVQTFNFKFQETVNATFSEPKKFLFEPNAAILKAGGFSQIAHQLNIEKLHQHAHLYTSNTLIDFPGRVFEIQHCISYDKKEIKKFIPSKKANITTRNFPETVAQIRNKTGLKDGGNLYLFFTTNLNNQRIVLICKKV